MLNPFSISLAVQPLKIYSGLCLNEGSSLTHRAPLILGEKTNSCPADTRLTVPFPSPGDAQPFLAVIPHHLCSPTNTSAAPVALGVPICQTPGAQVPTAPRGPWRCSSGRWGPCLPRFPACTGMGQATGPGGAANSSLLVLLIPKP